MRKQVKIHFLEGSAVSVTGYINMPIRPDLQTFFQVFDNSGNLKAMCNFQHVVSIVMIDDTEENN